MKRITTIAATVWIEMLRKKDVYVLLILMVVLLISLTSMNIFGLRNVAGYVKDIGLLFAWLFGWILSATVAARELPEEEKRGTIYPLLAKPVSRLEVILGKWLGAWSVVCAATLCFYALLVAVAVARGSPFRWESLLEGYALHAAALAMTSAMALALSTRMNFDAAVTFSLAVTGSAILVVPRIPNLVTLEQGVRAVALQIVYYVLPHFELFDMRQRLVHDEGPIGIATLATILAYGLLMTVVFLMLAWLGYRHKRFLRGNVS